MSKLFWSFFKFLTLHISYQICFNCLERDLFDAKKFILLRENIRELVSSLLEMQQACYSRACLNWFQLLLTYPLAKSLQGNAVLLVWGFISVPSLMLLLCFRSNWTLVHREQSNTPPGNSGWELTSSISLHTLCWSVRGKSEQMC